MAGSEEWSDVEIPGSFELFYQEEYSSVVAIVYGLTGSRWVAEDLTQEAFLRAHRDWDRVVDMESSSGWVRHVAINLAHSRFRRVQAEARARLRLGTVADGFEPKPEFDEFWSEVRRLPTRQAQALALRYIDDLPITDIADVLKIAEGSAKALLHQGTRTFEATVRCKRTRR